MTNEREVEHLKELLEVKARELRRALDLQAREYERRLEQLNNAHSRALDMASRTVSRELFDSRMTLEDTRRDAMCADIEALRRTVTQEIARASGRGEAWAKVAMVLAIAIPLILKFIEL